MTQALECIDKHYVEYHQHFGVDNQSLEHFEGQGFGAVVSGQIDCFLTRWLTVGADLTVTAGKINEFERTTSTGTETVAANDALIEPESTAILAVGGGFAFISKSKSNSIHPNCRFFRPVYWPGGQLFNPFDRRAGL